jgi:hypothetical protein
MTRLGVFCVIAIALGLAGCGSSGGDSAADKAFTYSEATIDRFVSLCLQRPGVTVAQCACVLERYRAAASESEFLTALADVSPDGRMSGILGECQIEGLASFVAKPDGSAGGSAAGSAGAEASQGSATSASSSLARPVAAAPPVTVVRAATNVEACVQEKIAAATAGGKSMPLDAFDKIRAECGG